jgi:hypothetical protein
MPHLVSRTLLAGLLSTCLASEIRSATLPCREILTFADGNVPRREVFVAPTGNDVTGDGTELLPYRSLGRAAQGITPGTAIRMLPGTYAGGAHLVGLAGTAEAPVWIGGVPDQPFPVISGGSTALQLSRVRHLIVEHLEITGASVNGINCDDGGEYANPDATRFVLFRHLYIHGIGTGGNNDCLKLSGLDDYWVLDCTFAEGSAGGSGIDHVGCHRGIIARCSFTDMGSNAVQCKGGSDDIEIKWSRFRDAGARAINIGGSTGFEFFRPPLSPNQPNAEARNIRVLANVFEGSDAPVAYVGSIGCLVAQNTLINPTRWILRILQETTSSDGYTFLPCSQNRFVNNLLYFSRSQLSTFVNVGPNTAPDTFTFAHNLWFAHDQPGHSAPSLPVTETNPVIGQDPQFTDVADRDLTLVSESPAIGHGQALSEAPADFLGQCFADPPSIGAFEAEPSPPRHSDTDSVPDWWEDHYTFDRFDPTDGAADPDADHASNREEYLAGTDPTDPFSVLRIISFGLAPDAFWIQFPTTTTRVYAVEIATELPADSWSTTAPVPGNGALRVLQPDVPEFATRVFLRARAIPRSPAFESSSHLGQSFVSRGSYRGE